jgi:ketosteroid isomerase-like protein
MIIHVVELKQNKLILKKLSIASYYSYSLATNTTYMTQKQIAEAFSNGDFEKAYPFLAADVQWTVIGENKLEGKQAVIENCEQTANYFKSVTTDFKTINVIAADNRVAVNGTAAFIRDGKTVSFVSACDVYEFNNNNELQTIMSYCIQEKN